MIFEYSDVASRFMLFSKMFYLKKCFCFFLYILENQSTDEGWENQQKYMGRK